MTNTGIEPATLRTLTRRSNQLSYAAAQNYHYLLYKQTFPNKSTHNRKLSFATHQHKIVTVFEKSMQKFSIFYFKIAKSRLAAGDSAPRPPIFLYCSHTALFKKNTAV